MDAHNNEEGGHIFDSISKLTKRKIYKTFGEYFCFKGQEMVGFSNLF